jgi:uncharacterized membrane protein
MAQLLVAAIVWTAAHVGLSGTRLRDATVARLGERGFRGIFSLISVALIVWLVVAYAHADTWIVWVGPDWFRYVVVILMLPTLMLFAGSLTARNPTLVGVEGAGAPQAVGITRITRHPMLVAFAIWAGLHVLANGDIASILFFGAFLVTALAGMPSIDAKLERRAPDVWTSFLRETSIVPFAAILQGRNRLALGELGWKGPLGGLLLWALLLLFHATLFGGSPLPG